MTTRSPLPFQQHLDKCFTTESGLDKVAYASLLQKTPAAVETIQNWYDSGDLPLLRLPEARDDLAPLYEVAAHFKTLKTVYVIGTGGSSSGGQALLALRPKNESPRIAFIDNLQIGAFDTLLADLDPATTGVIAISKSGGTGEVMAQFLVVLELMKAAGALNNVVTITEPKSSPLKDLATANTLTCLDHDPKVGGRFSVLSIVGLLPALIAGLDIEAIRDGANDALQDLLHNKGKSAAAEGAALTTLAMTYHLNMHVLMPYVDPLKPTAFWYRQLWAESLGKEGRGSTPIDALGTVDQHSQLQLYLGGPKDKLFTLIQENVAGKGAKIPSSDIGYLNGATIGDLLAAHQKATAETLAANQRPTRLIQFDTLDERTLGALLMHFMLETIVAAQLLGIDAFDQPAVEQSKILVKEYLTKGVDLGFDTPTSEAA